MMNKLNVIYKTIKWILNRPPELVVGDEWYVKVGHENITLTEIRIESLTHKTDHSADDNVMVLNNLACQ